MTRATSAKPTKAAPATPSAAPDRRQRRSTETRERLFRAALRLFARKGFAETTVEDITNAADVGKGTFFNYFPSKEHLLTVFSDMQMGKLQAAVESMRHSAEPMQAFLKSLSVRLTEEPARQSFQFVGARRDEAKACARRGSAHRTGPDRARPRRVSPGSSRARARSGVSSNDVGHAASVVCLWRRLAGGTHPYRPGCSVAGPGTARAGNSGDAALVISVRRSGSWIASASSSLS
jgi:AcrR family transcriptional regulator